MTNRPTVRCAHCDLAQFANHHCVRCRRALSERVLAEVSMSVDPTPPPQSLAERCLAFRKQAGWSQRQLAAKMGCARSWVSKVEQEWVVPAVPSIEKLARALGVSPMGLIEGDTLEVAMAPYAARLTIEQMNEILRVAERLAGWRER